MEAGAGTTYEVASDLLSSLREQGDADGPCIETGRTETTYTDDRAVVDDGFYYLVRGTNACGPATGMGWGMDSMDMERAACP